MSIPFDGTEKTNFENLDLWNSIYGYFLFAKEYRDPMVNVWRNAEIYNSGEIWKDSNMPKYKTKIVDQSAFEAIETTLPVATARPPKLTVSPKPNVYNVDIIEQANDYAHRLEQEFDENWVDLKMTRLNRQLWRNFKGYGNCFLKSEKDPDRMAFTAEIVDIFTVFPDPFAASIEACADTFFIHAPVMYVSEIEKRWGAKVPTSGNLDRFRSFGFGEQSQEPEGEKLTPVGDTKGERLDTLEQGEALKPGKDKGQSLVLACYWNCDYPLYESFDGQEDEGESDHTQKVSTEKKSDNQEPVGRTGDKDGCYENGRLTIISYSKKGLILYDGPNDYGVIPYFMAKNYSESSSFWGKPESKQMESYIKNSSMIMSQTTDNIRLTANPKHEVHIASGIKANEPGTGHQSRVPNGFKWIIPPLLRIADTIGFLNYLDKKRDDTSGIQDSWRGYSRPGDSGRKAELLRNTTGGRIEPSVDELVDMYKELAKHWNYIVQNMYYEPKLHKIKDEKDPNKQFVMFQGTAIDAPGRAELPEDQNSYGPYAPANEMEFEVDISAESMIKHNEAAEFDELSAIAKAQIEGVNKEFIDLLIDVAPNIRDKSRAKQAVEGMTFMNPDGTRAPTAEEQQILDSGDRQAIAALLKASPELNARAMGAVASQQEQQPARR